MISYIYLALAIFLETIGTNFIKTSEGFTKLPYVAHLQLVFTSYHYQLKGISLNVAYATWAGLGLVLTTTVAVVIWKEQVNWISILGIALITVGVVLLNVFGGGH